MLNRWMRVTDWNGLTQAVATARRGLVRVTGATVHAGTGQGGPNRNQIVRRILLESSGALFVYGYTRRRYGTRYIGWPPEWKGCVVELKPQVLRSQGQRLARRLRLWARYILRHTAPDVWTDLRGQAETVTPAPLRALAAMVGANAGAEAVNAALAQLGLPGDVYRYRTTTLRSEGASESDWRQVEEAFRARRAFEVAWRGKYDCRASGKPCPDGVYRAWLSTERRGLAHGHYWLLLDGERAIFGEDD